LKRQQIYLTNERLKYKFKSFFELANYGIKIAKEEISHEQYVTLNDILQDLAKLPDQEELKKA
jgi:hypothetical protein